MLRDSLRHDSMKARVKRLTSSCQALFALLGAIGSVVTLMSKSVVECIKGFFRLSFSLIPSGSSWEVLVGVGRSHRTSLLAWMAFPIFCERVETCCHSASKPGAAFY